MTIEKIKEKLLYYKDSPLKFRYNGSRNQVEEFTGTIVAVYKAVFVVKPSDSNILKSFSYADVLVGTLHITAI